MNNEQLQDWLCDLPEYFDWCRQKQHHQQAEDTGTPVRPNEQVCRGILHELAPKTNLLLNYFLCNYDDTRLSEPLITQILPLYYKFGVSRCFVQQLLPTFIYAYLKALAKRWPASSKMLEMFFLAIYNEEILADGPGTPSMLKRTDEVRLPTLRLINSTQAKLAGEPQTTTVQIVAPKGRPSQLQSENASLGVARQHLTGSQSRLASSGGGPSTSASVTVSSAGLPQKVLRGSVRIGPFPAVERMTAENRFVVLTRLTRQVNQLLTQMAPEVACRSLCHSLLYICRSGFSFQETDFRQRHLHELASDEVFADFSRKSRILNIPSHFLVESINGLTFSLMNGQVDVALRALDAIHQRAQYEMMPDVLLETNALRRALSDSRTMQAILGSEQHTKTTTTNGGREEMETVEDGGGVGIGGEATQLAIVLNNSSSHSPSAIPTSTTNGH